MKYIFAISFALLLAACGSNSGSTYSALSGMTKVWAGARHACGLKSDGTLKCWGSNGSYTLGNLSSTDSNIAVTATVAPSGISELSGGWTHTCVLASEGMQCWGSNANGKLGNGSTTTSSTPVVPSNLSSGITSITASADGSCSIQNGSAFCWGFNSRGTIGDGTTTTRTSPTAVTGLSSGASGISGYNIHCAIKDAANYCWGWNGWSSGITDDSTTLHRTTPIIVPGLSSGVTAVSARGEFHVCAIKDGGAYCFGDNYFGQLGNGTVNNSLDSAVAVTNLTSGVTHIAAGGSTSCAIANNDVYCWGNSDAGQLGNGSLTSSSIPVLVPGLTGATDLSLGMNFACAVHEGAVKCWGYNYFGQVGNGTNMNIAIPTVVVEGGTQSAETSATLRRIFLGFFDRITLVWNNLSTRFYGK